MITSMEYKSSLFLPTASMFRLKHNIILLCMIHIARAMQTELNCNQYSVTHQDNQLATYFFGLEYCKESNEEA